MKYKTVEDVVNAVVTAYYKDRNAENIIECVTERIEWMGSDDSNCAVGKEALRKLFTSQFTEYPESFQIKVEPAIIVPIDDKAVRVSIKGKQISESIREQGFIFRLSGCCLKQDDDTWLIDSVHASISTTLMETFILEQELDEVRKKEQTLISSIPGGIAIYRIKKGGKVETDYISTGFAKILGYDNVMDLLQKTHYDAMQEIVEEDREYVIKSVRECLKMAKPISVCFHVRGSKNESIEINMDANVISEGKMSLDDVAILYAVHTAVSQESHIARKEQEHYRNILNMTEIAYFEWNADGGFYSSPRYSEYALSNYGIDGIMGRESALSCIHPEDTLKLQKYIIKKGKNEDSAPVVVRMKMQDGAYRWTEVIGYAAITEEGDMKSLIGVLRDVNPEWEEQNRKLKSALRIAEKANQAKTDFLSRVSHDMRTPLNGILGLTSLMQDNIADEKTKKDLSQLEQSGKYLLNLINDTLDVCKIESGKLELKPTVCDGRSVLNNILSLINPNMKEKNIHLNVQADNLPYNLLYIDVGRIEQIIMNILGNAVKFTPEGGTVAFTVTNLSVENGVVTDEIIIQDNGIGMSQEFLPHMFEAFSQENNTNTSNAQGTGLGMAITKQILDLMKGSIKVESELGKGTKFTLVIPMMIATQEQIESYQSKKNSVVKGQLLAGKHILLCEDHPLNANIAIRLLESKNMKVEHAVNGQVGLEMFEKSPIGYYDAILMDIRMPIMNGIESTKEIRALSRKDAKEIPIIAMTANAFQDDVEITEKAGMNAHLSKPIEINKLFNTLEELLKLKSEFIKSKILVVDDIELNRAIVSESLKDHYDVLEASNGKQALEVLAKERSIEAIITDIQMPEMDGIELIRRIRANNEYRHIAIIANTQYGDPEQENLLIEMGANEFVYKPSTPKILEMRIHNVLKKM